MAETANFEVEPLRLKKGKWLSERQRCYPNFKYCSHGKKSCQFSPTL